MSSLKSTIDKIKSLEAERGNLLLEIDSLRKMAEAKANALENEVSALREEIKSLKLIVGSAGPAAAAAPVNKIQI
ncbi:MAG: hypothetical protein NWE93_11985 [Candidatus Bathyarchaeota archaeon]|nr:hypothetical protein [Candidatus Bathyarchaeota archaeon]